MSFLIIKPTPYIKLDVTLSRQEGSTTRHLASAQYWTGLAGGNTGRLFLTAPTGLAIVHWIGY